MIKNHEMAVLGKTRDVKRLPVVPVMLIALIGVAWTTACQKSDPGSSNTNSAPVNNSSTASTSPSPAASEAAPATETPKTSDAISLATPVDTYKTGYAARNNKDIATLKRVLSKDALEFLTEVAKEDKKTLDDQLKELTEKPQAPTAETRNVKITGNRASLEYLNEKGEWSTMDFSKEGSDWKIDFPKGP